jgi:hypothetical protein
MEKYEEAIINFNFVIACEFNENKMEAFEYKGMALREINEYEEAISIFK